MLVHGADVSEREGAGRLLRGVWAARQAGLGWFKRLKHLWLDAGYQGQAWLAWVEATLGWTVALVRKPSRWGWYPVDVEPPPVPAFTVVKRRWVVERTFSWLDGYRRLTNLKQLSGSQNCWSRSQSGLAGDWGVRNSKM